MSEVTLLGLCLMAAGFAMMLASSRINPEMKYDDASTNRALAYACGYSAAMGVSDLGEQALRDCSAERANAAEGGFTEKTSYAD